MALTREISNSSILKITTDTLSAGLTLTPKLDAIASVVSGMVAPSVRRFGMRMNMLVNTGAGGGPMAQLLDCFGSIVCRDVTGERINWVSGLEWRNKLQQWYGLDYHDGTDIGNGLNNQVISQTYWLPFVPRKVVRPADFYIPATDIFSGFLQATFLPSGTTFGSATTFTFVSGTVDYIVDVVEEGQLEAKARVVHRSLAAISNNSTYPVGAGGTLLNADYWNGRTNQLAGTPAAAQNLTSNTLKYNQIPSSYMRDTMFQTGQPRWQDGGPVGGDQQDPTQFGNIIPILVHDEFAGTVDMPLLQTLHYQTDGTVTTSTDKIELSYIEGRNDAQTARQLRVTEAGVRDAVMQGGYVPTANGKRIKAGKFDWDTLTRAPLRLDPDLQRANAVRRA